MELAQWQAKVDKAKRTKTLPVCGNCGFGLRLFRESPDGQFKWCPNCYRDDGSGGAGIGTATPRHGAS